MDIIAREDVWSDNYIRTSVREYYDVLRAYLVHVCPFVVVKISQ